jgi:hypothetical protein
MENKTGKQLHTLIPLEDFKTVLGLDDRDEALSRFCLMTATFTIEQYCRRRLLNKKHYEALEFYGDYVFPLRDYPVREILAVYAMQGTKRREQIARSKGGRRMSSEELAMRNEEIVESDLYGVVPDCGGLEDVPGCLSVSPALRLIRGMSGLKVHYWAG